MSTESKGVFDWCCDSLRILVGVLIVFAGGIIVTVGTFELLWRVVQASFLGAFVPAR